jgi:hypothetical protein
MDEAAPQAAGAADERDGLGGITAPVLRSTFDHWRIFGRDGKWQAMRAGAADAVTAEREARGGRIGFGRLMQVEEWVRVPAGVEERVHVPAGGAP